MSAEQPSTPAVSSDRRPLKTRSWKIFQSIATSLARSGVSPNAISSASIVFAFLGACGFLLTRWGETELVARFGWLLAVVGIQLRLIANLLDGMVAVEGGRASATGPLFNEVPDRVSDPILLIAAGYALGGDVTAGWAAAVLALFVAYVRAISASVGAGQLFHGPMAKQQRMALLTLAAAVGVLAPSSFMTGVVGNADVGVMQGVLWLIVAGCIVTSIRRLGIAAKHLRSVGGNES